jgi:hypothetical protein
LSDVVDLGMTHAADYIVPAPSIRGETEYSIKGFIDP